MAKDFHLSDEYFTDIFLPVQAPTLQIRSGLCRRFLLRSKALKSKYFACYSIITFIFVNFTVLCVD